MSTPEAALNDFEVTLTHDDVQISDRETIHRAFLDTGGVTLAGTHDDTGKFAFRSDNIDPETADPTVLLGLTEHDSSAERALSIDTASHVLAYDDLSWAIDGHPSVTLIPPLLALAADTNASGSNLVTAYAAGFEVECAPAQTISPVHYEIGWHATATFGALGATAAAASLLNLTG